MSDEGNHGHHDDGKGHDDQSHRPGKQGPEGQEGHSHKGHGHSQEDCSQVEKGKESHPHVGPEGQRLEGHSHHGDDGKSGHGHEGHGHGAEDHEHGHKLMDAKSYTEYWKTDDVIIKEPHECLIKYQDHILGDNMECLKILVPLCGRVFEMKYFADLGHEVVGVEFAEIAIQQFFKIFDIKYETRRLEEPAGIVYNSTDDMLNIRIYCCDVFQFGPHLEKDFHAVWDSGAMHSLPKEQMIDYVKVMKSVLDPKCKSLVEFTHPSCSGNVTAAELQSMYGEDYVVKGLGYTKTTSKYYLDFDIEGFHMYLVSPR